MASCSSTDVDGLICPNLHHLREMLIAWSAAHHPARVRFLPPKEQVVTRIESHLQRCIVDLAAGQFPQLVAYSSSSSSSSSSSNRITSRQRRQELLLMHLLVKAHQLLTTGTSSTKRDIYYENVSVWTNQMVLDQTLVKLTRLLDVPRRCLNISATCKGIVAGSLTYLDESGRRVDCRTPTGLLIPEDVDRLSDLRSDALCVLVIEKDSTLQKLLDEGVHHFIGPCILITGKGYPDVSTRRFLRRLWDDLRLPLLGVMDADPHGVSIMAVYRFGSQMLEEVEQLAVPQLRWLGLHPTDVEGLGLPTACRLPLTQRDRSLIVSLAKRPFISDHYFLAHQLNELKRLDCKAEIQGLVHFGAHYLARSFLPAKIRAQSWL